MTPAQRDASDLDEQIRAQDKLLLRALASGVDQRFIGRMVAVRIDAVRELGAVWGTRVVS